MDVEVLGGPHIFRGIVKETVDDSVYLRTVSEQYYCFSYRFSKGFVEEQFQDLC